MSLRLTDTNNGSDSSGRTWGLEGNLVWWLIGGVGLGIVVFFVFIFAFKTTILPALGGAVIPPVLVFAYVSILRQGKPPGYDRDLFATLVHGHGFAPDPDSARSPFQ